MAFVVVQIVCQVALLFDSLAGLRIIFRSAAFLMSLAFLVLLPGKERAHPARTWVLAIMGVITLAFIHPGSHIAPLAAVAQWFLYLAILAPIFWVDRLRINSTTITRLFVIIWIFHTASAFFGILQVYYPGKFEPTLSKALLGREASYLNGLKITLANGRKIWRPMGLTDQPGGAGSSGLAATLIGLGLMLSARSRFVRLVGGASMAVGLFSIFVSMVRVNLVIAGVCILTTAFLLIRKGDRNAGVKVLAMTAVLGVASFAWAASVGGKTADGLSVEDRFTTLIKESPDKVYQKNRGHVLANTFLEGLPDHPLGAGLGRWGMMNYYFGDPEASKREGILGGEIQWSGWLFDGGLPLMLCYSLALFQAARTAWRLATTPMNGPLAGWSVVLAGRDVGAIALTFSYPLFISQGGMEHWMLNAAVYSAFLNSQKIVRFVTTPKGGKPAEWEHPSPLPRLAL